MNRVNEKEMSRRGEEVRKREVFRKD